MDGVAGPRRVARAGAGVTRVLVTGSRDWRAEFGWEVLRELGLVSPGGSRGPVTLVHGACGVDRGTVWPVPWPVDEAGPRLREGLRGVDRVAHYGALALGWGVDPWPAEWARLGNGAGPKRNQEMVDSGADLCLAFPLQDSRGTWDCARRAHRAGIPVHVWNPAARRCVPWGGP